MKEKSLSSDAESAEHKTDSQTKGADDENKAAADGDKK